jgi:hypothetical protein
LRLQIAHLALYQIEVETNMKNIARTKGQTLEEQRRVCLERWCGRGAWLVQYDAHLPNVWQVTHATKGGAWTVAATDPICPHCWTTLELEDGFGGGDIVQPGPLVDWLRTL